MRPEWTFGKQVQLYPFNHGLQGKVGLPKAMGILLTGCALKAEPVDCREGKSQEQCDAVL